MSGKIDGVPRELLEVIANSSERTMAEINTAIQQAREIIAAPVVERQPVVHTMKSVMQAYENAHAVHLAGTSNFCAVMAKHLNAFTSPPAPVALNVRMAGILQSLRTNANPALFAPGQLAEVDACLDKLKELNQ